jgi:hypothetical protein
MEHQHIGSDGIAMGRPEVRALRTLFTGEFQPAKCGAEIIRPLSPITVTVTY